MADNYINMMEEDLVITLTLDDDTEEKCIALCKFDIEAITYIALLPISEDGMESLDGDVYFYEFTEQNGQPGLSNIVSDDVYMEVSDAFDAWLEEMGV